MPEYSSTTITPADAVKVPAMNGSTSGNFELSALMSYILASKGQANGLASLGSDGKLAAAQIPDLADDVIVVASVSALPASGVAGKLYIEKEHKGGYIWDDALGTPAFVKVFSGETEGDLSDLISGLSAGTVIPLKATQDASGNVITTTYETKADANDLKNACEARDSALDKRVANLEQKAGDELSVTYPSSTYGMDEVPSNVAKYAKGKTLIGVTRGVNQLAPKIQSNSVWETYYFGSVSKTDDKITGTITTANVSASVYISDSHGGIPMKEGHRYLVAFYLTMSEATSSCRVNFMDSKWSSDISVSANTKTLCTVIVDASSIGSNKYFGIYPNRSTGASIGTTVTFEKPIVCDLNQYFSSDPSVDVSTLTISDIQSKYPELLIPSDYDAGRLVSTEYSGLESIHKNLFDDSWLLLISGWANDGTYYHGMSNADRSTFNAKLNSDLSPKIKGRRITISLKGKVASSGTGTIIQIVYSDSTSSSLSINSTTESTYTLVSDSGKTVSYVFFTYSSVIETYIRELQVEIGASATSYSPYGIMDTISLSSPVELISAGSVHEELDVESGVKDVKTIQADLGDFTWAKSSAITNGFVAVGGLPNDMKGATDDQSVINASCSKGYACTSYAALVYGTSPDMAMSFRATPNLGVVIVDSSFSSYYSSFDANAFKTAVTGIKIVLERASYTTEQLTPVLDPFIQVEGGGTIRPTQSQTTKIDSSMTAEYLSIGA